MDVDDDPACMLQLLDARFASNRTVSKISVQTQPFRMAYTNQSMTSYIDEYTSLFSKLESMGKDAAIPESHKAPMLLASIDPNCPLESTAAALRTKEVSELTWGYVTTTLIEDHNAQKSHGRAPGGRENGRNHRKQKRKDSAASARTKSMSMWKLGSPRIILTPRQQDVHLPLLSKFPNLTVKSALKLIIVNSATVMVILRITVTRIRITQTISCRRKLGI